MTLRACLYRAYAANVMKTAPSLPTIDWEYIEFDMPTEDQDRVFLGWIREGWELVGVHPKGKGQRKPLPVAIMRREIELPVRFPQERAS